MKRNRLLYIWSFILCVALAGCGSSEDEVAVSSGGAAPAQKASVVSKGAELQLDFHQLGNGTGLSSQVDRLTVSGFDQAGIRLFGPHSLAKPANDVLVLNMHPDVTLVEIEASNGAVLAQATNTAPTKLSIPVKLTAGASHKVVVVVNGGSGNNTGPLTPVVVPGTLSVLPSTPSIPATFVAEGSGHLNGGETGTDCLVIDLNGRTAVQLAGLEADATFTLGRDNYQADPDLSGTLFSTTGNLSAIAASFSFQKVTLRLYTSTDGLHYQPYADGIPILIDPSQADSYGQTVINFPFDLPMAPNLRYVWVCLPVDGTEIQGTLSIATTVDLAADNLK